MNAVLHRRRAGLLLAWAMLPLPLVGIVLPPFWAPAAAAAILTFLYARRPPPRAPRWALNLLGVAIVAAVAAAGGWRVGPLRPLGHLLLLLAAVRVALVADRATFLRALQVVGVVWTVAVASSHHWALLGYLAASAVLGWGLGMRLLLEGLGVPPHRAAVRWRQAAAAGAASLLLAAPVFVVMPRLRSPVAAGLGSAGLVSGFGATVDVAGVGTVERSRRLAVVVTGSPRLPEGTGWMYLRGAATLWLRTGAWRAPSRGRRPLPYERGMYWPAGVRPLEGARRVRMEVLSPRRFLPLPDATVAVKAPLPLLGDRFGSVLLGSPWRGPLVVTAWVGPEPVPRPPPTPADRAVARHEPRIARLATEVAGDAPDAGRAAARLTAWLRRRCSYTLDVRVPLSRDPLPVFLFETRRGHCELFATALAAMLRELGHPARVVAGYAGGTLDPDRTTLLVRAENAHAWVEVWDRTSRRWLRVDPSPPTRVAGFGGVRTVGRWRWLLDRMELLWDRHLLGFGLGEQVAIAEAAARAGAAVRARPGRFLLPLALVAAAALLARLRPRPRRRPPPLPAALLRLGRRLAAAGTPVPPGATLRRIARRAATAWPALAPPLAEATALAELELYGPRPLTPAERRRAAALAREILRGAATPPRLL